MASEEAVAEREDSTLDETRMTLWEHLDELRDVIIWSVGFLIGGVAVTAFVAKYIFQILLRPLYSLDPDVTLYTFSPPEIFIIYLKIAFFGGLVLSFPLILWKMASFIIPGLTPRERKMVLPAGVFGLVFFAAGACFAYFVVLPLGLRFFIEFNEAWNLDSQWRASYYMSFALNICVVFGGAFEMPLVVTILAKLGIASPEYLRQMRKYALIGIVAASALLTPPDVVTQISLAVPLWLLYELSILMAWFVYSGDDS